MQPPIVAVRGEVQREVPPEIARFGVEVAARDPDRQAALTRLTKRVEALRALLDEHSAAIERRETGGVYVRPETKRRGERVTAYSATVSTTITVTDLTVVGDLMLRLADQDQTTVYGPWWSLRPDSPAYRQARRDAVADAVSRAREYADAVGARLDRLVEIADVGADAQPLLMPAAFRGGGALDAEGGPPQLDLEPQIQTIFARVALRFTLTEPSSTLTEPSAPLTAPAAGDLAR